MKQTIAGQQELLEDESRIIGNIRNHYRGRPMPAYEISYVEGLQERIQERQKWIEEHAEPNMGSGWLT